MLTLEAMLTGMCCGVGLVGVSAILWIATVSLLVTLVGTIADMVDGRHVRTSRALAEAP